MNTGGIWRVYYIYLHYKHSVAWRDLPRQLLIARHIKVVVPGRPFGKPCRLVTRETKGKSLKMAQTFLADLMMSVFKSCRNSKAFDADTLSIFHFKHLGPRAIVYITKTCQIPSIWKSSLIIPIPKVGKDITQENSYQRISLLWSAAKVMETLIS